MSIVVTTCTASLCSGLESIKRGNVKRAVNIFERTLDNFIICISKLQEDEKLRDDQRTFVLALRAIRSYRRRHPPEPDIEIMEDFMIEQREDAQKILDKLES